MATFTELVLACKNSFMTTATLRAKFGGLENEYGFSAIVLAEKCEKHRGNPSKLASYLADYLEYEKGQVARGEIPKRSWQSLERLIGRIVPLLEAFSSGRIRFVKNPTGKLIGVEFKDSVNKEGGDYSYYSIK